MKIYKDGLQTVFDLSEDITFYRNEYAIHVSPEVEMKNMTVQNGVYHSIGQQQSKYRILRFLKVLPTLWSFCK